MKKAGFFLKIYLGFWLTIVMVAGVFVYTERLLTTEPMIKHWKRNIENIVSFHAEEAVAIFERDGSVSLKKYFLRLETATHMKAYLFSDRKIEVTGQSVRNDILEQIDESLLNNHQTRRREENVEIITQTVKSPKGHIYVFAAAYAHPKPPGLMPGPPPPMLSSNHPPDRPSAPPRMTPPHGLPSFFGPAPQGLYQNFFLRLCIGLLVSAFICYWLARYLTGPIFKLRNATRQLADGNLSVRVKPELKGRRDELSSLASDFDIMAERLETLVTSQRNLLRDVSHELRSPLARLNVALELCRQHSGEPAQKHLDRMALEIQRLNELIGQILTYNKMNAQTMELTKTLLDLSGLVKQIVSDAAYETGGPRILIQANESILIDGNEELLRRAIENIIRNALCHTPANTTVEISSRSMVLEDRTAAHVIIRDHGDGVPSETLPLIFKPFFKLAGDREPKTGAGLGLAISEAAIRLHHGVIRAQNADDGGLIMEIILPARPPVTEPPMNCIDQ